MPEMDMELKTQLDGIQAAYQLAIQNLKADVDKRFTEAIAKGGVPADIKLEYERIVKRMDALEVEWNRPGGQKTDAKSLGEQFIESDVIKDFAKRPWHKGGISLDIPTFFPNELKTVITSAAVGSSTPGILVPQREPGIIKPGVRRLRVRDLMRRARTSSNAIEYVKENAFTNLASPVAETISKPESALTFTIASSPIRTLATWIPVARQILDDFAALQGYIDQRLMDGLMDVEDIEIVSGDGTGQHLSGLTVEAGTYDTARNVAGDTKIDKLNHAISQVEDALQVADGIILHPRDWRAIQLIKEEAGGANTGMYLLGGPQGTASPILWGLPVAVTTAVTVGTFFVGAFQRYCTVWDRMEARIDISTEHADYFVRNMIAVRAEERIGFTVFRNDAVIYGSF